MDKDDCRGYKQEIKRLRQLIRTQQMPEGYGVCDDATTEFAVELAEADARIAALERIIERIRVGRFDHGWWVWIHAQSPLDDKPIDRDLARKLLLKNGL